MVTPIWTKPAAETLPPGIGTRLRATYANQSEGFVRDLVSEIESRIPDTTLFALRKLKRLVIVFEGVMGRQYEVSFNKQGTVEEANIRISTQVVGPSEYHQDAETVFEVVRRTIYDLPSEELRSTESTDIVLGFQVDAENGEPVVPPEGQPVFAFLPIERLPQLPASFSNSHVFGANQTSLSSMPILYLQRIVRQFQTPIGTEVSAMAWSQLFKMPSRHFAAEKAPFRTSG